jgi:hypothetical protein
MSKIPDEFFYDETFNPHDWLADYAYALDVPANSLFAMGKNNEPFNLGTPKHFEKARWFADVFGRFGYSGVWLRRLHYRMVHSDEALYLWDGVEYLNTDPCWQKLQESSKLARLLRLVDPYMLSEKRNKATPTLRQRGLDVPDPAFEAHFEGYGSSLPLAQGPSNLPKVYGFTSYAHPTFEVSGYDYSDELQPILVEVWSEVEDASLHGVALRHGVNYIPGLGFQSVTAIKALLARLEASSRPARILYVSDFDPGGTFMYNSVSRHLHFACWELEEIAVEVAPSIKVDNVAITREQVEELNIPRIPIKETDTRRAKWELAHGEGGVEVEALEATHPRYLERLLASRIADLQDSTLRRRVAEQRGEANRIMQEKIKEITDSHEEELREIRERSQALARRYRSLYKQLSATTEARYERLKDRHDRHLAELEEDLQEVEDDVREKLENMEVDLPDLPEAEAKEDETRVWYFDSERDFEDQTDHFRRKLGKDS